MPACPVVAAAGQHQELAGGRREGGSGRALGQPHGQGRRPQPGHQRLHEPLGGPARDRPGPRGHQVEPVPLEHRDGPGEGVREQPHVGVDEREHPVVRRGGGHPHRAGVRLAEPARRRRVGRHQPDARIVHRPRPGRGAVGRPSSTTTTRRSWIPRWSSRAARHSPTWSSSSRTGSTTVTGRRTGGGSAGGRRSRPTLTAACTAPATESRPVPGAAAPLRPAPARWRWTARATSDGDGERERPRRPSPGGPASPRARARRRGSSSRWPAGARHRRAGGARHRSRTTSVRERAP